MKNVPASSSACAVCPGQQLETVQAAELAQARLWTSTKISEVIITRQQQLITSSCGENRHLPRNSVATSLAAGPRCIAAESAALVSSRYFAVTTPRSRRSAHVGCEFGAAVPDTRDPMGLSLQTSLDTAMSATQEMRSMSYGLGTQCSETTILKAVPGGAGDLISSHKYGPRKLLSQLGLNLEDLAPW